jgi:hypothetical protein
MFIDSYISKVYTDGSYFEKLVLCSIPIINFKIINIASKTFSDTFIITPGQDFKNDIPSLMEKLKEKVDFQAIFLSGVAIQAAIAVASLAAVKSLNPVTAPSLVLGLAVTGLVYVVSTSASLIKYIVEGNINYEFPEPI